jgi:hypothetical protein
LYDPISGDRLSITSSNDTRLGDSLTIGSIYATP